MTQKPEHPCLVCGKMTTNAATCSRKCAATYMRGKAKLGTQKLAQFDDSNICRQCKKPMPPDRYSMYCEECEMHIEEEL